MFAAISLVISMLSVVVYSTGVATGKWATVIKMIAAAIFVVCGFLAIKLSKNTSSYSWLIVSGLVCGFIGDFFLASVYTPGLKWSWGFEVGMFFFLIEHVLLIIALTKLQNINLKDFIITAIIYIPFLILFIIGRDKLGILLIPMIIYGFVLFFITVKAFSLYSTSINEPTKILLILGIAFFCLSDIILGLNMTFDLNAVLIKIFKSTSINSQWIYFSNSVTYFLGQTMIASTIYYINKT